MKIRGKMKKMTHLMATEALRTTCSVPEQKGKSGCVFVASNEVMDDACVRKHCSDYLSNALAFKRTYKFCILW